MRLFLCLLLFLCNYSYLNGHGSDSERPNILLIFVDDMGYGDLGCYGGSIIPTPNIDHLADNGIRFTQGYSASSVCGPSRVGLLTGLRPSRLGVYSNPDMGRVIIPDNHPSLGELFQQAGYRTGIIGKWNLNEPRQNNLRAKNHFDYTHSIMVWEANYWPDSKGGYHGVEDRNYGSTKLNGTWGPLNEGDEYLTDRLSRKACDFIREESDTPFFLYLAYNAPHSPLQGKAAHLPQLKHIQSEPQKLYASMLLAIEEGVGNILETLREQNELDHTIILFVSDNGPAKTNFKGLLPDWPRNQMLGSTAGFNGGKGTFLEGGIRVPFILYWPDVIQSSRTNDTPITTLDLYPTLGALVNAEIPSSVKPDGINLLPHLFYDAPPLLNRTFIWYSDKSWAVREGDWKLVYDIKEGSRLFNLKQNPTETENRIDQDPDISQRLQSILSNWEKEIPPPVTPRKTLRSL